MSMAGLYMQFYGSCGLTSAQAWILQGTLKEPGPSLCSVRSELTQHGRQLQQSRTPSPHPNRQSKRLIQRLECNFLPWP